MRVPIPTSFSISTALRGLLFSALFVGLCAACSAGGARPESGGADGAGLHADGVSRGGGDGGGTNAQPNADAGTSASDVGADASPADAGPSYGPAPAAIACTATTFEVYAAAAVAKQSAALPRGALLACAADYETPAAHMNQRLKSLKIKPGGGSTGLRSWLLTYRTERAKGVVGVASARVYQPLGAGRSAGFVVVGHGSVGLADLCAPSLYPPTLDYLVLPWIADGWTVIAPDYAGLGTDGVQGYLHTRDTGRSVFDAARALGHLMPALAKAKFTVIGHSQGGGAAMAAQAMAQGEGFADRLVGSVAFAPGYAINDRAKWVYIPTWETGSSGYAVMLMYYADLANGVGLNQAGRAFRPKVRETLVKAIENLCVESLEPVVDAMGSTFGEYIDPQFVAETKMCLEGGPCTKIIGDYVAYTKNNVVPLDPKGPPLLLLSGGKDKQVTPEQVACTVKFLADAGVAPQVCHGAEDTHFTVVSSRMALARTWVAAALASEPLPSCPTATLPACTW